MYSDAMRHAKNCPECAFATGGAKAGCAPLNPIPVQQPFQIIGTDVMDLPRTEQGNKHVLVFPDFLSRCVSYPRIVKILVDEVIPFFGIPEPLLSD